MKIDPQYVDEEILRILAETNEKEEAFLRRVIPGLVSEDLMQSMDFWKNYGAYWWNLGKVMQKYAPELYGKWMQFASMVEEIGCDTEVKAEYDMGTDMKNFVAAQLYLENRTSLYELGSGNRHRYIDNKGEGHDYIPGDGIIK